MGGERWLMFKSVKEAEKAKAYLAPLDGGVDVGNGNGVWLDWTGKLKLEVGYQANVLCTEVADIVCREICKRFSVTRLGSGSVGWYPDSEWEPTPEERPTGPQARYGKFTTWVAWMKDYKRAFSHYFRVFPEDYTIEEWDSLEQPVLAIFAKLDQHPDMGQETP